MKDKQIKQARKTHKKLIAKWSASEFGIKQRVFKDDMPQTTVQYILSNPNYGDIKKMEWLIETVEKHAKALQSEVQTMLKTIKSL